MRIRYALAALGVASATLVAGAPAQAAPASTQVLNPCPAGEAIVCLYYNSNRGGAMHAYRDNTPSFSGDTFVDGGPGDGTPVKNNAASAQNNNSLALVRIFFNSNYGGASDWVYPDDWTNLVNTYNNNASLDFFY